MDLKELVYGLHKNLVDHRILLVYEGEVNQEITKAFTNLTQKNLEETENNLTLQKRVYHVMVECLQNIGKHSDSLESGEPMVPGQGLFMVSKNDSGYTITTGNAISNSKILPIKNTLDQLNGLNHEQVKELYKKKIVETRLSEKGGAGLGFIDIVKKTGNVLEYEFEKINDKSSFFILRSAINKQ